jgi:SPP1 gp7 family putative phage head morphogenesis protein
MAKITGAQASDGKKTPVEGSIIDRVVQGVKFMFTGDKDWFGPGQPVAPQAQGEANDGGAKGRQFDFAVGYNTRRAPRDGEGVTFDQMRGLADGYDLLRLAIETRKDQMSKLTWTFKNKDEKVPSDARCQELNDFFAFPDQEHDWETWLRALLEDLFVLDAPTVYPRMTLDGSLYSLELVDGATVKRVLDATGRTPLPPETAYQQVLKGIPAVDYNRDELIYKPLNVRTSKVYGYSPVEQIVMTVNIALRRQVHQLQFYTEGNIPEALIGVPEEWNPDQIRQFQEYWDSLMEGNTAARRHAKFVPGGLKPTFTKEGVLKDEYDEWLARIICFAFSISPQSLVKAMNRATAETAQESALQEGLIPVMNWVRGLINYIVWKYFGYKDIEFAWEEEDDTSPMVQAQILQIYAGGKPLMTQDEAREKIGLDPMTPEQGMLLNPPPPPALLPDGTTEDPDAPPDPDKPKGKGKPEGKDKPDAKDAEVAGKSLGKSVTRRVQPLSRNRASAQGCTNDINTLVKPALLAMASRVSKEVAAALGKATKPSGDAKRLVSELTFLELAELAPQLETILGDMAADGGAAALAQVLTDVTPDNFNQVNARAVEYAKERSAELVTSMEESTRDMLRTRITTAMEEGWSNDKLADSLVDNYAFSDARAETIARTETAYADVQGNLEGYRVSGVVQGKQWIIAQDETCDDCIEMDGIIVALSDPFPNEGGDGPPLHPNCRCDVLPVLTEEDK